MILDNKLVNVGIVIEHEMDGAAMCSIGKKEFVFVLTTTYAPAEGLLEFIEYERVVAQLAREEATTIEKLADKVFTTTQGLLHPLHLTMKMEALTDVHGPASITITDGGDE